MAFEPRAVTPKQPALPFTGASSAHLALAGAAAVLVGLMMVGATRRHD